MHKNDSMCGNLKIRIQLFKKNKKKKMTSDFSVSTYPQTDEHNHMLTQLWAHSSLSLPPVSFSRDM